MSFENWELNRHVLSMYPQRRFINRIILRRVNAYEIFLETLRYESYDLIFFRCWVI